MRPGSAGEVKALRWREDVDLIAGTVTVNIQSNGAVTTPKGRTRRTVPMTETLKAALKSLEVVREGNAVPPYVAMLGARRKAWQKPPHPKGRSK